MFEVRDSCNRAKRSNHNESGWTMTSDEADRDWNGSRLESNVYLYYCLSSACNCLRYSNDEKVKRTKNNTPGVSEGRQRSKTKEGVIKTLRRFASRLWNLTEVTRLTVLAGTWWHFEHYKFNTATRHFVRIFGTNFACPRQMLNIFLGRKAKFKFQNDNALSTSLPLDPNRDHSVILSESTAITTTPPLLLKPT